MPLSVVANIPNTSPVYTSTLNKLLRLLGGCGLTSSVYHPGLLHGLLEYTQSIMERTLGFIQNLLGCSSHHNSTCLPQCHTRETKQLCEKGRKEHYHIVITIHPLSPSQILPTSSLLEHPPFPPNLILILSRPSTNLKLILSLTHPPTVLSHLSQPILPPLPSHLILSNHDLFNELAASQFHLVWITKR